VSTGQHHVTGTFSFSVDAPQMQVTQWTVYLAQAPEMHRQTKVSTTVSPAGTRYEDLGMRHRPLVRITLPVESGSRRHQLDVTVVYRATLHARELVDRDVDKSYLAPTILADHEREFSLAATELMNFTESRFQLWLDEHKLRRRPGEDTVDFAERVFRHLCQTMKYEYKLEMDRHASYVGRVGYSDCGGMSILFVATMRANGIPARVLAGRWNKSSKPNQHVGDVAYYEQHVKAEFYTADVGWVPVDVSSGVLHDREHDGLRFFGRDRGDFLVLHVDPEIQVDTPHFGRKTFPWLQGFHYYVRGEGNLTDVKVLESWHADRP
jgi:transglutaminase-like putative cysteine protease